ncbi:MAG: hypothetical protein ACXVCF_14360 [Isosphaeraceae bacterium]
MTEEPDLSPLELLVLTRLLPVGEKGDNPAKIRKDLEPLLEHRWSGSILTQVLDRTLIKLATRGLVARPPAKRKKAVPAVLLTPEGRQTVLASLNVSQLPAKPKPTWPVLKKSLLLARSLGLPAPGQGFSKGQGFKAAVLRQKFGLPLGDYPDLKSVKLELTRKLLGMGPKEKITLETVQAAIFGRELGENRPADPKKVLDRLVSRQVGARRDDEKELRDAVLRGWISGSVDQPDRRPSISPSGLADFVQKVRAAAEECASGRFGDNKVFIIHVWRALQNDPDFRGMDLPAFKQRLAEANNARLLDLSRADLVQAMDPDDVRLSEVTYLNAAFHFIRIGSERHDPQ